MIRLIIMACAFIFMINLVGGADIPLAAFIDDKISEIIEKVLHPESVERINNSNPLNLDSLR